MQQRLVDFFFNACQYDDGRSRGFGAQVGVKLSRQTLAVMRSGDDNDVFQLLLFAG